MKLGELSEWIGRRNMSVGGIAGGFSRGELLLKFPIIYMVIVITEPCLRFLALATQVPSAQKGWNCPIFACDRWLHDFLLCHQLWKDE